MTPREAMGEITQINLRLC